MSKILILGFLIAVETTDDAEECGAPVKKSPTLDDLFAGATRSREEESEENWKEKYGPIFT